MTENKCPLCLDKVDDNYKKLPDCTCSLILHPECYDAFVENKFGCPICTKPKKLNPNNRFNFNMFDKDSFMVVVFVMALCFFLVATYLYFRYGDNDETNNNSIEKYIGIAIFIIIVLSIIYHIGWMYVIYSYISPLINNITF